MSDVVIFSNEVLTVFMIFGLLGLISCFLLKLYNILEAVDFYTIQISVITLALGTIAFVFVMIGSMITVSQNIEANVIEYTIYLWFSRIFIVMIWILWFAELIIYAGKESTTVLTRMTKRRDERINRNH